MAADLHLVSTTSAPTRTATTRHRPARYRCSRLLFLRCALAVLAAGQVGFGVVELAGATHTGREIATWTLAAGIGLLSVVLRPRAVHATLPILATAAAVLTTVAARDLHTGTVNAADEAPHLLLVLAVAILTLIRHELNHPRAPTPLQKPDTPIPPLEVRG